MRRVVVDTQLAVDDDGYPLGCPEVAAEVVGLGTFAQQTRQLCALFGSQTHWAAGRGSVAQSLDPCLAGLSHPLADRPLGNSEGCGDVPLLPVLLSQLPGAQPAPLAPTRW